MTSENIQLAIQLIPLEIWNTLYMVFAAAFVAIIIGLPLGALLAMTERGRLKENNFLYHSLGGLVNIGRSIPFAILIIALIPITRWIVGTSLGTTASIVPLAVAAIPFFARIAESAFKTVDKALIEAAIVMGSTPWQILTKVLLPEALPTLILGATTTIVNLVGYSAMAGTMGGGGLGKIAIQYGYQRFNPFLIGATVVVLVILVQLIQWIGNYFAQKINQKRGIV